MLIDRYDAFLLDLDGVLYRGNEPIAGAAEGVAALREADKGIAFLTNNSSATPERIVEHLAAVGIGAEASQVETSALATASLLAERYVERAYVVGEEGLADALLSAGIGVARRSDVGASLPEVTVVVVGLDREADYASLRTASMLVDAGASLVAANPDTSFPAPGGARWPGAGALLAAIEAATGVRAEVVGKPNAPIFVSALRRAGGGRPLVIGDRLDTDIAGAAALGWDSLLVLTGIDDRDGAAKAPARPTYVGQTLSCLVAPGFA